MAFFKKETEADKIMKEITNTQFKRDTILASIDNDKTKIVFAKNEKIMAIGQHVYDKIKKGESDFDITSIMTDIANLDDEIAIIEDKMKNMAARYDEEIAMLQSSHAMYVQPVAPVAPAPVAPVAPIPVAPVAGKSFCEECGKPMEATDMFCGECGTKVHKD